MEQSKIIDTLETYQGSVLGQKRSMEEEEAIKKKGQVECAKKGQEKVHEVDATTNVISAGLQEQPHRDQ